MVGDWAMRGTGWFRVDLSAGESAPPRRQWRFHSFRIALHSSIRENPPPLIVTRSTPSRSRGPFRGLPGSPAARVMAAAYFITLMVATHLPRVPRPPTPPGPVEPDKLMHFGAYATLALLLAVARPWPCRRDGTQLIVTALFTIIVGGLTELTQPLFGRNGNLHDVLANALGGLTMVAVLWPLMVGIGSPDDDRVAAAPSRRAPDGSRVRGGRSRRRSRVLSRSEEKAASCIVGILSIALALSGLAAAVFPLEIGRHLPGAGPSFVHGAAGLVLTWLLLARWPVAAAPIGEAATRAVGGSIILALGLVASLRPRLLEGAWAEDGPGMVWYMLGVAVALVLALLRDWHAAESPASGGRDEAAEARGGHGR